MKEWTQGVHISSEEVLLCHVLVLNRFGWLFPVLQFENKTGLKEQIIIKVMQKIKRQHRLNLWHVYLLIVCFVWFSFIGLNLMFIKHSHTYVTWKAVQLGFSEEAWRELKWTLLAMLKNIQVLLKDYSGVQGL